MSGAEVSTYLFPAILLLLSSDIVEPPHLFKDVATCPRVGTVVADVLVDEVISDPTAASVKVVTLRSPVDESVVNGFVPLLPSPSSVMSESFKSAEYVPPSPATD